MRDLVPLRCELSSRKKNGYEFGTIVRIYLCDYRMIMELIGFRFLERRGNALLSFFILFRRAVIIHARNKCRRGAVSAWTINRSFGWIDESTAENITECHSHWTRQPKTMIYRYFWIAKEPKPNQNKMKIWNYLILAEISLESKWVNLNPKGGRCKFRGSFLFCFLKFTRYVRPVLVATDKIQIEFTIYFCFSSLIFFVVYSFSFGFCFSILFFYYCLLPNCSSSRIEFVRPAEWKLKVINLRVREFVERVCRFRFFFITFFFLLNSI